MRLLVTGGAGFIGSNFLHLILEKYPDYYVVNYDALTYAGHIENLDDIKENPNYKFVKGDKQPYIDYFNRYGSMGDHAPEAFERLIEKYREDYLTPNGKKDIPLLVKDEKGRLLIIDGFHRCAIHKLRGNKFINTFVFSQKAEKGFLPFPK